MKKFFFTAIASFFFFSSLNGAEATQYPPSFPYSIFRLVSSGIYGLINTDWKIGALEYCDELGLNCTDIANVITTDTTCDGGTCNIANTGTLDGYEASALLDNTDDQTLSLVTNTLSIENGNSVDLSGYLDNTDTTYTAGGSLLQLVGTTFSVDEGTLTDGNLCSYVSTGTKVQCTTPDSSSNWNTAYGWGNHASAGYYSAGGGTVSGNVSIASNNNFTVDTNTFFVDGTNNRVGVGTTSPTGKLDVLLADDTTGYAYVQNSDGSIELGNGTATVDAFKPQVTLRTAGTQAATFTVTVPPASDTGTLPVLNFDVRQSDNTPIDTRPPLGYSNNGTQIFSVDPTGKMGVGLGSTLPSYTLEVGGSGFFNTGSGSTPFYLGRYNSTAEAFRCWVDDNNVVCAIEQDENSGTYGSMQLWLDNDGTSAPYFLVRSKSGTNYLKVSSSLTTVSSELNVTGVSSDGTGKALCIKSDGNVGTCTNAVGASGTCTCS